MENTTATTLTEITREAFDKKVDMARGYLEYMQGMKPAEARQKAVAEVSEKFVVKA